MAGSGTIIIVSPLPSSVAKVTGPPLRSIPRPVIVLDANVIWAASVVTPGTNEEATFIWLSENHNPISKVSPLAEVAAAKVPGPNGVVVVSEWFCVGLEFGLGWLLVGFGVVLNWFCNGFGKGFGKGLERLLICV